MNFNLTAPVEFAFDQDLVAIPAATECGVLAVSSIRVDLLAGEVGVDLVAMDGSTLVARRYFIFTEAAAAAILRTLVAPNDVASDIANDSPTSGTTTSVTKTGAGWTAGALVDKIITFTAGTNAGMYSVVTGNTTDTITFVDTLPSACDATSTFNVHACAFELFKRAALTAAAGDGGYSGNMG